MSSHVIEVNQANFQTAVIQRSHQVPVLVDFWAPWCMPCRMVAPTLEQIAAEYCERARVVKVNTDENTRWAIHYGVRGIPTLLFIWQGHEAGHSIRSVSGPGGGYLPVFRQCHDRVVHQPA